jgi:hypothetical protein
MFLDESVFFMVVELSTKANINLIFGPRRDEVTGGRRKLCNEERHNVYSSTNIIKMMKLRTVRLACHIAWMGKGRIRTENRWENQKQGGTMKTYIGGRIVFKYILNRMEWIDLAQQGPVGLL